MSDKPFYHVVVGIVVGPTQNILISKRPSHKIKGGYWEFPGGKIEKNETPVEALGRELKEEVGIEVQASRLLFQHPHEYLEYNTLLEVFLVTKFLGEPTGLEGQEVRWISRYGFSHYDFLEANHKIIEIFLSKTN